MGDKNQRQAHFFLDLLKQVNHLRLNRHIQRTHRLVANNQLGLQNQRAGDADALALAAGKFVRVAVNLIRQQAHFGHNGFYPRLDVGFFERGVMGLQRLGDDVAHGHAGVERRQRVLENHLDVFALQAHGLAAQAQQFAAFKHNAAGTGFHQADDGARQGGFAAAGFAHDAQGFAGGQLERHIVYGFEGGRFLPKPSAFLFDVKGYLNMAHAE